MLTPWVENHLNPRLPKSLLKNPAVSAKWANCPSEMRGHRERSGSLFSYVSIEERIPASHPLRRIRKLADQALDRLNPTFCADVTPFAGPVLLRAGG